MGKRFGRKQKAKLRIERHVTKHTEKILDRIANVSSILLDQELTLQCTKILREFELNNGTILVED